MGIIPLAIVIGVVAVLIITQTLNTNGLVNADKLNPASQMLKVGTKAPDFTLSTVDGKSYSLSSFKGKPVLLEFFAVWCPHCQRESTVLNQVDSKFGPKGLQSLAILANPYGRNYDTSGQNDLTIVSKSDINWFEQTFGVKHPTLIDPSFATVNTYGASSYPTIYVIDKQGIVRYAQAGEQPLSALATAITAASK
jgi:peroxiredoxin